MKTFNFFEKLWEHSRTLRRVGLVLVMCLIATSQVWAEKGFFSSGQWNIRYYRYGASDNWGDDSGYGNNSYIDLGIQTTLELHGCWVKTWSNDKWTQKEVCWYAGFTNESMTYQAKETKSDVEGNQTWSGFGIKYDLIANAPNNPGNNTLYMYWRLDDHVSTSTSRILYTIPGFTTTSTSQTFDNTAISSTNDKTISFGTHYGTALTTGNCSITGTNASEFSVRSINESGVTVRFSPTTPGNKSATLTITDAHSKTCTITLSGKTKHTVTYNTTGKDAGSAPSDATQYEYNTTVTVKDNTGLMTKSGKVFAGWATSSGSSTVEYAPSATFSITQDMNLYPVWTEGHYLISLTGSSKDGTKDGTNFYADQNLASTAYTVNGVCFSKSHYKYGGTQSPIKGASNQNTSKFIFYDTERTGTKVRVYVYNKAAQAYKLYYNVIKEGTAASSDSYVSVPATSGKMITIDASSTKGARVCLTVENNTNLLVTEVIAIETGERLHGVGRTNYELAFPGRPYTYGKAGAINRDSIVLAAYSNITLGQTSTLDLRSGGSYYAQIKTPAATQLRLTITSSYGAYVCTDKNNPTTTGVEVAGSDTRSINLPSAGTYYVLGTSSGNTTTISKIAFANYVAATAPTAFASTATTSTSVTLSITDATNSKWEIYYSTSSTPPTASTAATEDDITSKTPTVTGLTANTDYYMWVRSVADYFNKSSWVALTSNPVSTDDTPSCSATAPGTISKGTLSGCSITLTASGSAASNNTWYWQASADGTSTSESGATKDVTAPGTYYIRSFYSTGSCWSDAESYTITASDLTPAAPSALAAASPTAKGVTLTVTDAANTNDYEFYVSTDDDEPGAGTSATHSVTDAKSLTITNLVAGTTYYAWARAKCGSNKSDWIALGSVGTFTTSTVSADYHLTNVTKTTGATSGIGGSEFEAVFAAVSGYSMPNPTVTIDGNSATSGTDYTWNAGTGTLTINANKINGNIDITLNSAAAAPSSVAISGGLLYFAGETIELTATPTGGNGPVTYQWYKGGKENVNAIEGATSATYTKASCAFDDAGSYYCKVTCGGSQSTWGQSGNAYDVKIPRLYVKTGHNNDLEKPDFGNVDFTRATASTATASIVLGSSGDYCFNIADGCGHYYGNSGTMQYNNTGWITNVSPQDCGLTTTNAGTYIFTINYSTWSQLTTTITFPSCTDPGLAFASASKSVTLCDDAPTNALTNTHGVTVSYASSDETVATVASDGTLTIKKAGTTTITASSLEQTISAVTYCADNASYTLTVNASTAAGLAYGTATMEKNVGDANFTNTLTNTNSLSVTYSSSDEDVATVASDGTVTIKAAGTTTITASSAQQKVSSTCYAEGEASYTLTVYPVYTVSYNAMGGTCSPTSTNTTTALGKVTLPSATHAIYTTYTWVTSDGTEAGDAGDTYTPEGNINLYAKWSGSCAGGGGTSCVTWEGTPSAWTTGSMTVDSKMVITADPSDASKTTVDASQTISKNPETITKTVITIKGKDLYISGNLSDESEITSLTISASSNQDAKTSGYAVVFSPNSTFSSGVTVQTYGTVPSLNETYDEEKLIHEFTPASGTKYFRIYRNISAGTEIGDYTVPSGGVGGDQNIRIFEIKACKAGSTCYTVTYHGNGATSGYVNDPAQHTAGSDVTVMYNDPTTGFKRTGYEFNGWNTKDDASGTRYDYWDIDHRTIEDIAADVDLYAEWRIVINADNTNFEGKDTPTAYKDVKVTNGATLTITNATTMRDVTVTNGATLKIQKGTTVHDITVETGSTLNIAKDGESGVTLTANSLALKGGWDEYKENYDMPRVYIDPKSTLTKTVDVVNFDISVDYRNYYPFALPFDVTINDESNVVDYAESYIAAASTYGTHYAICEYDGEKRAEGKAAWKYVPDGTTLKAGKGYILYAKTVGGKGIIRFPLNMPSAWTTLGEQGSYSAVTKNEVEVTAWGWDEEANDWKEGVPDSRKGWNLLGVPFMSCFDARDASHNEDVEGDAYIKGKLDFSTNEYDAKDNNIYVTVPVHDFSEYIQSPIDEAVLLPGWCFFIQVAKSGTLTFAQAGQEDDDNLPIYAPKREQENMPTLKTGIILTGNGAKDKTNFLISDKYSASEYEFNADLEKMFGENSFTLATYSLSGETRLAYNAMSNADAANIIPIGYRAPADGEYTFSINPRYAENGAFEHVNLIDYETGIMTDLLMGNYTFSTERTQLDTRFALNVVPRQNTPTDIETVGGEGINDANAPRKVLINDKMYIIVDGKMYDATGKAVK